MPGARVALVVAVCLVALNMRPTITAIGPLLEQIGTDTGMGAATLGLVAAVPLAAWALVSPFAHDLSRRFGMTRTVTGALLLLTAGTVVRSLPGPVIGLWLGTALIGVALAVANVLMPAVVKREFPARVPAMMATYSALLGGAGAIASGLAVPTSHLAMDLGASEGWRTALLVTGGALLLPAIIVWIAATRGLPQARDTSEGAGRVSRGVWSDATAWVVAAYMGFQSALFYILSTWLATIAVSTGRTAVVAGLDVMIYQAGSVAGALLLPLAFRGAAKRWVAAALPLIGMIGAIGLMVAPDAIIVWILFLGPVSGASLGTSLILMAERARDHHASSALSGMSQSVGYLMAAAGPVLFGTLYATTGGWIAPLVLLTGVLVGQVVVGLAAGRERYVLDTVMPRDTHST
ncbi:MFS transporter [Microbacterium sediminicola]|uniref:MFS transporter n=2 Tax=Microbacterium sediminicola TaxID=415210 RepID=A0ABP4UAS9_9MICO